MMSNNGKTADIDTGWDMYRYQVVIYGGGEKGQDEAHSLTMMSYCTRMREFIDELTFNEAIGNRSEIVEVTP